MTKSINALTLMVVASLVLAACGPQLESPTVADLALPAPGNTSASHGGTLVFGRGGDSVGLDPITVTDGESYRVSSQCLEPLYQYEPGTTKPIPALATGCTANADNTEWTCSLRQNVQFHGGTDFNHTVKFILDAPLAPFLANLAMDMFAISSPAAIEQYDQDYGTPAIGCVGTGWGHNSTPLLFSNKVNGYQPQPVGADYYKWVILEP